MLGDCCDSCCLWNCWRRSCCCGLAFCCDCACLQAHSCGWGLGFWNEVDFSRGFSLLHWACPLPSLCPYFGVGWALSWQGSGCDFCCSFSCPGFDSGCGFDSCCCSFCCRCDSAGGGCHCAFHDCDSSCPGCHSACPDCNCAYPDCNYVALDCGSAFSGPNSYYDCVSCLDFDCSALCSCSVLCWDFVLGGHACQSHCQNCAGHEDCSLLCLAPCQRRHRSPCPVRLFHGAHSYHAPCPWSHP